MAASFRQKRRPFRQTDGHEVDQTIGGPSPDGLRRSRLDGQPARGESIASKPAARGGSREPFKSANCGEHGSLLGSAKAGSQDRRFPLALFCRIALTQRDRVAQCGSFAERSKSTVIRAACRLHPDDDNAGRWHLFRRRRHSYAAARPRSRGLCSRVVPFQQGNFTFTGAIRINRIMRVSVSLLVGDGFFVMALHRGEARTIHTALGSTTCGIKRCFVSSSK